MSWNSEKMADEVIALLKEDCTINLGIGLPTIVAQRIPKELNIMVQSENGVLGVRGRPTKENVSPTLINAGKETISISDGASFFDSSLSFGMIRGGHIDYCILGGMQVDVKGNLANWMIPGKKVTGMGGAMDLANGAKNTIIMMKHFTKKNECKLVKDCSLPLTAKSVVDKIVTNMGIFMPDPIKNKFKVLKLANGIKKEDLKMPI